MRLFIRSLIFILLSSAVFAQDCKSTHGKRRVLVLGLDGTTGNQLHYQALVQNKMPTVKRLMLDGKFTSCINEQHPKYGGHKDPRCARAHSGHRTGADFQWLTGPGWLSVLTGADNSHHGVKDNKPENLAIYTHTKNQWPTFFMRAKEKGLRTAAGGVANFLTSQGDKSKPGILDYECGNRTNFFPSVSASATSSCNLTQRRADNNDSPSRDKNLAVFLTKQIQDSSIDIIMGVFDGVDSAGHHHGFSSNKGYLTALSQVDQQLKPLLNEVRLRAERDSEEWLVLLTSDHGGHNVLLWGLHDTRDGEDDAIPFIVTTYGACGKLHELRYPVTHMDVHPTVMAWFEESSPSVDGHIQGVR